jgi:hypothetical protein
MTATETYDSDPWAELERAGRVAPVSEEVLLATRVAVRRAATTETLHTKVVRVRRRRLRRTAVALVAAAVVAGGAVTVRLGDHQVGGSPAAAAVLERAARVALAQHDPVVRPGQYLKLTSVQVTWGAAYGRDNKILRGADGRLATFEERQTRTIWIPYDVDADWTVSERTTVLHHGTTDPRFQDHVAPSRTYRMPSGAKPGSHSYTKTYDPHWYASLPHDPAKLLRTIRATIGGEGSGAAYDFSEIYSEVLRSGLAPASVRSAVFSALSKTPDLVVEHDVTTLDGRAGIAIGTRDGTSQLIFDAKTGQYVGERGSDPDFPDVPGMDADKTTLLSSVTTAVVEHAPRAKRAR